MLHPYKWSGYKNSIIFKREMRRAVGSILNLDHLCYNPEYHFFPASDLVDQCILWVATIGPSDRSKTVSHKASPLPCKVTTLLRLPFSTDYSPT